MSQSSATVKQASSARFPIRMLAERTGVGTSNLRAWERRYGLLSPERTPKGHRLYSEQDVQLVERVLALLEDGHSLSAIAEQVKAGTDTSSGYQNIPDQTGIWSDYCTATLRAVQDFSSERIEAIYNEAASLYPVDMVTERLIEPTLVELGESWRMRETGIAEEHFYTSWVRNRLGARFHHASGQAVGARILCACLPGSRHEIGLMLFSISALARGYRVLYLGADLPLDQVSVLISRSGARAVVLASRDKIDKTTEAQLAGLAPTLDVPLLLGGPVSDEPIPLFDAAGGVRLGSPIALALRVLGSNVPVYGGGTRRRGKHTRDG